MIGVDRIKNAAKRINSTYLPTKLYYAPSWIILGVNNICNLHCKMCDVGTQNLNTNFAQNLVGTQPINMPAELFRKIVDQTHRYFPQSKLGLGFTEPLIYPHLIDSLNYANQKGVFTSLTTNALNLNAKAEALADSGLNALYISLDGPEDVHNYIRGHKSSFQRAIKGIERLLEQKHVPEIGVYCCITEWNIHRLNEFADFFKDYPIQNLGFMHTNYTPEDIAQKHNAIHGHTYPATESNMDEINIDAMDLDLLWNEIGKIKSTNYPYQVSFSPEISSRERLQEFYHQPDILIGKRCHDAFNNIMIKSDGSVIPAHGRCYNLTIGNLYDQDLKHIWNSAKVSEFRSTLAKSGGLLPGCSRCCSAFGS